MGVWDSGDRWYGGPWNVVGVESFIGDNGLPDRNASDSKERERGAGGEGAGWGEGREHKHCGEAGRGANECHGG